MDKNSRINAWVMLSGYGFFLCLLCGRFCIGLDKFLELFYTILENKRVHGMLVLAFTWFYRGRGVERNFARLRRFAFYFLFGNIDKSKKIAYNGI